MGNKSKSFYEILQDKSQELASQLDLLRKRGLEEWLPMIHFDRGSHGGYPHIRNVERNADKMIPDEIKQKFEAGEIFLLLSSIFLHDIGKVVLDTFYGGKQKAACLDGGSNCKHIKNPTGKKEPVCGNQRMLHIYYGEKIIRESWGMIGLPNEKMAEYCATIAYSHGLNYPPDKEDAEQYPCSKCDDIIGNYKNTSVGPYGKLRIPLLASILRLADEADNSWMRSLPSYWLKDINEDSFSTLVKSFRRWVEDVEFCPEGKCIIMHIPELKNEGMEWPFGKSESKALIKCKRGIQKVLNEWMIPLNDEGVCYDHVFFEYQNRLYNTLVIKNNKSFKRQKFIDIFEDDEETKGTIREIVKAVIKLTSGSFGYDRFRWRSIETFVNHPLTDYDKWLARCLNAASGGKLKVEFIPGDDENIKVNFDNLKVKEIYKEFNIEKE